MKSSSGGIAWQSQYAVSLALQRGFECAKCERRLAPWQLKRRSGWSRWEWLRGFNREVLKKWSREANKEVKRTAAWTCKFEIQRAAGALGPSFLCFRFQRCSFPRFSTMSSTFPVALSNSPLDFVLHVSRTFHFLLGDRSHFSCSLWRNTRSRKGHRYYSTVRNDIGEPCVSM